MNLLIRQYLTLKEKYKGAVLLFRVGDFYETFNEDAEIRREQKNISVMERAKNTGVIKRTSLPFYSLDKTLRTLTKAGYKIAVWANGRNQNGTIKEGASGTCPPATQAWIKCLF